MQEREGAGVGCCGMTLVLGGWSCEVDDVDERVGLPRESERGVVGYYYRRWLL